MSLEFKNGWNVQKADYVARFGAYQQELNLLTERDATFALKVARLLYAEGKVGDMLRAAFTPGGERVAVEQGSHQSEFRKDAAGRAGLRACDLNPDRTLHFTLRHYRAGAGPNGIAFHCYLARNKRRQWSVTSISYFQGGVGLQMAQTGGRDFMNQLMRNFVLAHGTTSDDD